MNPATSSFEERAPETPTEGRGMEDIGALNPEDGSDANAPPADPAGAPHLIHNSVSSGRGEPHLVQKRE